MAPKRRSWTRHRLPALAAFAGLLPALVLACGGSDSTTGPGGSNGDGPTVSSVSVSPGESTAQAVDATVDFDATVTDSDGGEIADATVTWSSSDTDVAEVDGDGVATALANGTTEIVAEAEGVADTAVLTVDQAVASVAVEPFSVTLDAPGDTAHLAATASDTNGNAVSDAAFEWSSSDPSVATVDDQGVVTAEAEGEVQVSATVEDVSEAAAVAVGQEPSPALSVDSVSPAPLQEGQSTTVSGSGFATDLADNTVLVDGVEATVTAASETSLQITVPSYDCLPSRDVVLEVQTSGGSADLTEALTPDETPVSLAVGEQQVVQNPDEFCFQLGETSGSERYLLGVQSLSTTTGALTPVTVTSEAAGDGSGAAATAPVSLAADTGGLGGGSASLSPSSEALAAHREAEQRLRDWERRNLDPGAPTAVRAGPSRFGVSSIIENPDSVAPGDIVDLRVPDVQSSDGCADFFDVGGEVMAVGDRGIFVADTTNPAGGFDTTDYQDFSDQLDDVIGGTLVDYFGVPPELQGEKLIVLVTGTVNESSDSILGFVFSGDLFQRDACASSDEVAIYYARAPDPDNDLGGGAYPTDEARSQTPFIMAHEVTHVIQNGLRLDQGLGLMSSTVGEAQATLAEEVVGNEVTSNTTGSDAGFNVAFGQDADGIQWYSNAFSDLGAYFGFAGSGSSVSDAPEACGWWRSDASPCQGRSLWYGVGWSFLRWSSDAYGSSVGGESAFHQDLILSEFQGSSEDVPPVQPVADVLGVPVEDLMAQWSASLYVDNRITGADPELTIPSWDLRDVEQNLPSSASLTPLEEGFADWQSEGEIRASSAGYVAIDGADRQATAIRVRDGSDGTLDATMQVWLVRLE